MAAGLLASLKPGDLLCAGGRPVNVFEFFNAGLGRHLVSQDGEPYEAARRALSSNHRLAKGRESRLTSGWAIVRPNGALLQQKLAATGIAYDDRTRVDAFLDELVQWDGTPRLLLTFDKKPLPVSNLFLTVDLRAVRICTPKGVETFDFNAGPGPNAGLVQKQLSKRRNASA
jgi:hypothetical protein